ncbi:nucleotidyl transferase AbiEii/AbiGii toxin family protein [Cupriavidus lacunae]|uniref:nucleotidyl transferase AbiEii/AbiGii toxin family protein n=1 Tax=Cupriavidus lacunae TaxID=2666307 RepID=UPI001FC98992|nr:nucleotidyl transferase AbiEii/AbiGii toxin family protein [Cupriavidus lacunae]
MLFNGVPQPPRILFKGGTSLSKAFSLITRFSEDIDITVFREDLGQPVQVAELAALSGKKRRVRLEEVRQAAQAHIAGPMRGQVEALVQDQMPAGRYRIELDPADRHPWFLLA